MLISAESKTIASRTARRSLANSWVLCGQFLELFEFAEIFELGDDFDGGGLSGDGVPDGEAGFDAARGLVVEGGFDGAQELAVLARRDAAGEDSSEHRHGGVLSADWVA